MSAQGQRARKQGIRSGVAVPLLGSSAWEGEAGRQHGQTLALGSTPGRFVERSPRRPQRQVMLGGEGLGSERGKDGGEGEGCDGLIICEGGDVIKRLMG